MEQFKFHMPTEILFGKGLVKRLADHIPGERVLLISDPFLFKNGVAQSIGAAMEGKQVAYFSEIEPNPSCESVDAAAAVARGHKADCVVGLGGGSSMDVAKIVACLVTNEGSIYDYYSTGTKSLRQRTVDAVVARVLPGLAGHRQRGDQCGCLYKPCDARKNAHGQRRVLAGHCGG